ncbi:Mu transposase C-terminal domain-containing protein [Paenibacillus tyrfis]|uniref:Mu transposase C-terminal domain-containing protein n=1 Tax=Paenibacillus tyrfis TaxID=1501230 RepID=UPI00209F6684|nr:Mu transposase C-terminal domain-containing protein [Paenibacillus tyrfis]MCP1311554.1 Mu transposase C-terminal domain-containing protein [Paenibacillus tyrfis]
MQMNLYTNMVLEWITDDNNPHYLERILWISPKRDFIYVIRLGDDKFPIIRCFDEVMDSIINYKAKIVSYTMESERLDESQLKPKNQERSGKAWEMIKEMVQIEPEIYDPMYRGQFVRDACKEFEVTIPTVHKNLKRYWQGGKTKNAVLLHYYNSGGRGKDRIATASTKKRGRPRKSSEIDPKWIGINVDERLYRIFNISYQIFILQEKLNIKQSYIKMIRKFFVTEYQEENGRLKPIVPNRSELPLYRTYKYWVKKEINKDPDEDARKRYNERQYNLKYRPKTGSDTKKAKSPGSRFQIDATIADVYLTSSYRLGLPIGKPVIYTVIDVYSHLIVGLYVGLEGPSYLGAMMAILNAGSSKVEYCKKYGINITEEEWPAFHLPSQFTADRGELLSKNNVNIADSLNINIEYAAPFRADWKPLVESYFNLLNKGVIQRLPGSTSLKLRQRGERDKRLDCILTLQEFTQLIIGLVLKHNNHHYMENYPMSENQIAAQVKPIPRDLWNWGIKKGGALRYQEEEILAKTLLPRGEAKVTKRGIMFEGVPYTCKRAIDEGWFVQTDHPNMGKVVQISYDPRFTDKIFIRELMSFEECTLIDTKHHAATKTWDDYLNIIEVLRIEHEEFKQEELQEEVSYDAFVEQVVTQAENRMANLDVDMKKLLKGLREHRAEEKEANRQTENFFASREPERHSGMQVTDDGQLVQQEQKSGVVVEIAGSKQNSADTADRPSNNAVPLNPMLKALQKAQKNRKYK